MWFVVLRDVVGAVPYGVCLLFINCRGALRALALINVTFVSYRVHGVPPYDLIGVVRGVFYKFS